MGLIVLCSAHIFPPCLIVNLHDFWELDLDTVLAILNYDTIY
jgi:hypothetical protein